MGHPDIFDTIPQTIIILYKLHNFWAKRLPETTTLPYKGKGKAFVHPTLPSQDSTRKITLAMLLLLLYKLHNTKLLKH